MNKVLRRRCSSALILMLLLAMAVWPAQARPAGQTGPDDGAYTLQSCTTPVFINEFHYDNVSTDTGEFIEVIGPAGTDLTGWSLVLYNGSGGAVYGTHALNGSLPNENGSGFGTACIDLPENGLQNGSPDGIALVNASNGVEQFLSYEGTFVAVGGPADGMTSTAVGVAESSATPAGYSLQLQGTGECPEDFAWIAPSPASNCGINAGQNFFDQTPYVASTDPANGATDVSRLASLVVNFSEAVDVASGWYNINCSSSGSHTAAVSGGPQSFLLDPHDDLIVGDHCVVTIYAASVTDQDTDDPPDAMTADYAWSFDVAADTAPSVSSTTPPDGATGIWTGTNIVVDFSEDVDVAGTWYDITCDSSGSHTAAASGGPQSFLLDPDADLAELENCTVTVYAAGVTDQDADDPPDEMAADYAWSFTTGTAAPPPCGGAYTSIFDIQGSGGQSALAGSSVTTQGIVVGDFQDSATELSGFFLQDPWTDADPATSDGIFVYNGSYTVNVGDHVRLTGTVQEYGASSSPITEISYLTDLQICGSGYSVTPTPLALPIPADDPLYLEKREGMLVTWPQDLHVTETYNLGRYGEAWLSSGGRLWQPTNVVLPGAPANTLQAENDRNRILLDDDNLQQNADPIDHPSPGLTAANTLRSGDTVTGLTGCLSQSWSGYSGTDNYRIHPTVPPPFAHSNPRTAAPAAPGGTVTVASFNVLNYFNGPTFPTSRGADTLAEFNRQRDKIIPAIVGLQADVIGLMEIENDSGSGQAIQDLVDGLNAMEGAGSYSFVDTGAIGTDEIRVALLYRPARVTLVGGYLRDLDSINSRPTLAQAFQQNSTGEQFTVVVNHFKSKGCSGATGLDIDQGDGQGCYNDTRTQQATRLHAWIDGTVVPTVGDPDVLIIGDLNAYALEDPITTLTGLGYTNLVGQFEGLYSYSYVYMGQSGYLDHALATASIAPQVTSTSHWHINPDEPLVLDYNEEYKSTNQLTTLYSADAYRSSDHDPVLIGLYPFDFSDLAGTYETAWHGGNGSLRLGSGWTADPDFGPGTDNATDDGLALDPDTGWAEGATVRIYAQVTGGGGYLAGWFDWNDNGSFDELEQSVAQDVNKGSNTIEFLIPEGAGYATPAREVTGRFRLYSSEPVIRQSETASGGADAGEVEDYRWSPPSPTAVELARFEAIDRGAAIRLEWETASELNVLGFNLYRSSSAVGEYDGLNTALIPARNPGAPVGAVYSWLDDTVQPGVAYCYKLEARTTYGTSAVYGTACATVPRIVRFYLPLVSR